MGATLTRHLKVQHNIQWQSGYSRFRYKLDSDGYYRLQTVRYDSIELVEKLNRQQSQQQTETKNNEGETTEINDLLDNFQPPLSLINSTEAVDTVVNVAFGQLISVIEQEFAVTSESSSNIGMIDSNALTSAESAIAESNSKFEDQNGADSMDLENIFNSSFNFMGLNKQNSNLNSTFDTMQF